MVLLGLTPAAGVLGSFKEFRTLEWVPQTPCVIDDTCTDTWEKFREFSGAKGSWMIQTRTVDECLLVSKRLLCFPDMA